MAFTQASSNSQARLPALCNELLLQIFRENVPPPGSTSEAVQDYFERHSLSHHLGAIALQAFSDNYIHTVDLDIHCFRRPGLSRWHNTFLVISDVERGRYGKSIQRAKVSVRCIHNQFLEEVVDETRQLLVDLREKTDLKHLTLAFVCDEVHFAWEAEERLSEEIMRELQDLRGSRIELYYPQKAENENEDSDRGNDGSEDESSDNDASPPSPAAGGQGKRQDETAVDDEHSPSKRAKRS